MMEKELSCANCGHKIHDKSLCNLRACGNPQSRFHRQLVPRAGRYKMWAPKDKPRKRLSLAEVRLMGAKM